MENIYYLLAAFLIVWYFLYLRKISEAGQNHAQLHCKKENLQFISVARKSTRPSFDKVHGLFMKSTFEFEFSGDGESSYQGILFLNGIKLESVVLPPYRI